MPPFSGSPKPDAARAAIDTATNAHDASVATDRHDPNTAPAGSARPRQWLHIVLIACLTAGALTPIWVTEHFPTQNGPWFLLMVHVYKEYENPEFNFEKYYVRKLRPIPHMLHNVLVYSFSHAVPLLVAEKLALSIYVLLLPLSIAYLLSVVAPGRAILGYLAFLMIHTYSFYRGYHNFSLSIPLYFLAFGYWLRNRAHVGWRQVVIMQLLVALTFFAHLVGFALLSFSIGFYRLVETRSLKKTCFAIGAATSVGWLLFGYHTVLTEHQAQWLGEQWLGYHPFHWRIENALRKYFLTISHPAYWCAALPWLWCAYLIGRRILSPRGGRRNAFRAAMGDPLLLLVVTLAVLYCVLPYRFKGWHPFNARMLPYIYGLAIACAGALPSWKPFRPAFVATVSLAALAVFALHARQVVRMESDIQAYLSGIEHFPANGVLLPIELENKKYGQVRPLKRAYEYYHIAKGGANGKGIANYNTLVPLNYRRYPPTETFPAFDRADAERSIKRAAEVYDCVLTWGHDRELEQALEGSGFCLAYQRHTLRLYRNAEPAQRVAASERQGMRLATYELMALPATLCPDADQWVSSGK